MELEVAKAKLLETETKYPHLDTRRALPCYTTLRDLVSELEDEETILAWETANGTGHDGDYPRITSAVRELAVIYDGVEHRVVATLFAHTAFALITIRGETCVAFCDIRDETEKVLERI